MLVLSRRVGESVIIKYKGRIIGTVHIIEGRAKQPRIGFDFIQEYDIVRSEIEDRPNDSTTKGRS